MIDWKDIDCKGKVSGNIKIVCPSCVDRRKNKRDRALSVNLDKGLAKCHYCEEISIREFKEKQQSQNFVLPPQNIANYTKLSDRLQVYLKSRGISQKTIIENKLTEETYYQPAIQKNVANLVFNYFEGDTLINKKYRSGGKQFTQSKDARRIFYGINDIIGQKEVYIVEGEIDKLSLWEAGIKNCISLPNGANDHDDVWTNCADYLADVEKFYICTDMDQKGNEVSEKIAQRLGRWRCERVSFKHKDANEDLQESVLTLEESLKNSKGYPVSGTFKVEDLEDDIYRLYDNGLPETIYPKSVWFEGLSNIFSVMRGHLVTGTGIPSHGKSNFTDWYVLNLLQDYNMKASWFSPEHHPMELHQTNLIQKYTGKPFFSSMDGIERVTRKDIAKYKKWANEKIYLTAPEQNESPTWNWLFEKFKEQMYNFGIDIFVIDAFNKVLFDKGGENRNLINEVLTRLTSFAQQNNVIIFLIAHPTKMRKNDDGIYDIPNLYNVSGSADFRNQTHDGFCIYRIFEDAQNAAETKFVNLKTKFSFQGEIGQIKSFNYHIPSGRYYTNTHAYTGYCIEPEEELKPLELGYPTEWD